MNQLDQILKRIVEHIDFDHLKNVDDRFRRALNYETTDRPPLVIQAPFGEILELPAPWNTFQRFSYRKTFDQPAAMLQNMLLDRVVPGLLIKDDSPLAIRNNQGTIQIASLLGGHFMLHENNFPWVNPVPKDRLEKIAAGTDEIDWKGGVLPQSFATLKFYREKLNEFPPCAKAVQIALPDLQGPIDTADLLWGSEIYLAFADEPDLFNRLLSRIVDTMLAVATEYRKYTVDRLDPFANTQHGYLIPGRLLIRNDSAIMLSAETYAEFVRPHDARLLKEIKTGSIHFCGNGRHLVEKMLQIPDLRGLDLGQPHLMDTPAIYAAAKQRKVALTNLQMSRDDLLSGKAGKQFPTGVVFIYQTKDIEDAKDVLKRYSSS
jgi:hypothetical protein